MLKFLRFEFHSPRLLPALGLGSIFAVLFGAVSWRFHRWMPQYMYGDDLSNLLAFRHGEFGSSFWQILDGQEHYAQKYRPLFVLPLALLFRLFQEDVGPYLDVNVGIQAINAIIAFQISRLFNPRFWLYGVAMALAVATSRFALYQVTTVTGLLEGLAFTYFLLTVYCAVRMSLSSPEEQLRWARVAMLFAFACMLTHERYMVVLLWLALTVQSTIILPNLRTVQRHVLSVTAMLLLAISLFFKAYVVNMPLLVGTGGSTISFDPSRCLGFWIEAICSIFGFNSGPPYLVGSSIRHLGSHMAYGLAISSVVCFLALHAGVAVGRGKFSEGGVGREVYPGLRFGWGIAFLALGILLLVPPTSTIRLEQRWELAPYAVMLLSVSWALGKQPAPARALSKWLALALPVLMVCLDNMYAAHFGEIYLVTSARVANAAFRDLAQGDAGTIAPTALLAGEEHCNWTLGRGDFFLVYKGGHRDLVCFTDAAVLARSAFPTNGTVFRYYTRPHQWIDITGEFVQYRKPLLEEDIAFDFLKNFSIGRINDDRPAETPTGRGALKISWPTPLGPRDSLTVLSGFKYQYEKVAIPGDASLEFGFRMVFPVLFPARAVVNVAIDGESKVTTLYREDISPPRSSEDTKYKTISIPLRNYADRKIAISFEVETPGKDSSGHWVAFFDPRISVSRANVSDAASKDQKRR